MWVRKAKKSRAPKVVTSHAAAAAVVAATATAVTVKARKTPKA
jgi:hypothetical protein